MRGHRTLALAAAFLLGTLTLTPLAAQDGPEGAEAANQLREQFISGFNEADAEKAASAFTEGGVAMPPHSPVANGRDAIRRYVEVLQKGQSLTLQTLSESTRVVGDRVFDRGILFIEVRTEDGEPAGSDTGKYTLSARRDSAGSWRIDWMIWNYDHPPRPVEEGEEG